MRRTAAGDREAFATLYRRHHAVVYRFARLMSGCPVVAEDVVQEVFLVVMRDASRYDARRSSLTTYLYGVARYHTRRRLLRERRFVAIDESDAVIPEPLSLDDVAASVDRELALQRLRRAILSLPSRYREVVIFCDLEGLSYGEAAATIGCAIGTIRSRLHRARQLLTTKMTREELHETPSRRTALRCAV